MNAVGVDVSKGKSMVAVTRPFGEVVSRPFEVRHTPSEPRGLANYLRSLDGETRVIMEHTGRYYEPVAQMLHDSGIFVSAVNPKLIKDYGNNSLRKVKTDKADSMKIARYGLDNWVELRQHTSMDTIRYQLKMMNRQYGLYTKNKTAIKNNLIALLDQTYPGANAIFDSPAREDGSQKWVDFVASFWHVDCVRGMSQLAFTERYRKWCKRHGYNFGAVKAAEIHAKARALIAMLPREALTKLLIQEAITQLNTVSRTVELLRTKMKSLAGQLPEYPVVMSMYGVGDSLGPQLIAEIGDVTRFAHKGSLTAFAGVDPGANQSGTYEAKSTRASKRGSPELRKTLFLAMDVLIKKAPPDDLVFRFIDKKRAEGKPYIVEVLDHIIAEEALSKRKRAIETQIQTSGFPMRKTLKDFDFDFQPSIDQRQIDELTTMRFLENGENIVFLCPPGVGKTHLATALGPALPRGTDAPPNENRLPDKLKILGKYKLLVIDEIGYLPMDIQGANLFFQLHRQTL